MTKISVQTNAYIGFVALILLIPVQWLLAWLIAAAFHELCHWCVVRACGGDVLSLTIGLGGANMQTGPMPDGKRVLSVLAGPILGSAPALLGRWLPRVAVCSWVLSVYNLLPLLPLDGGRALQILLKDRPVFRAVERALLGLLILAGLHAGVACNMGILPVLVVGGLHLRHRKSPCKQSSCAVE